MVLAGAYFFTRLEAAIVIDRLARINLETKPTRPLNHTLDSFGNFEFPVVDESWVKAFLTAIPTYLHSESPPCFQILPEECHRTIDIPQMAISFSPASSPIWRWNEEPWPFHVSKEAFAVTDLRAIKGEKVKEATRWEVDQWELFAGPGDQVNQDDCRLVPLAVMLSFDRSLELVTSLEIGKGYWRDSEATTWNRWNW